MAQEREIVCGLNTAKDVDILGLDSHKPVGVRSPYTGKEDDPAYEI
jgi:hypothetical protein